MPAIINPPLPPQAELQQPETKTAGAPPPRPTVPLAAQAEPKRAADPLFRVANVRSDDVLNIRSGPSADFEVVGELPPDSRGIAVTSACRSKWCPVQHRSTSGWVNSVYLAPEEPFTVSLQGALHDGPANPAAGPPSATLPRRRAPA